MPHGVQEILSRPEHIIAKSHLELANWVRFRPIVCFLSGFIHFVIVGLDLLVYLSLTVFV